MSSTRVRTYSETARVLFDSCLVRLTELSEDVIKSKYDQIAGIWSSKGLAAGSTEAIRKIVTVNLRCLCNDAGFREFDVQVLDNGDCAQVDANFQKPGSGWGGNYFVGIRLWRGQNMLYACGNSRFMNAT